MKKILLVFAVALFISGCKSYNKNETASKPTVMKPANPSDYANTITAEELKEMLYTYASDEFEGRMTGEPGQKKAVEYIKADYVSNNIPSPLGGSDYFQEVPLKSYKTPKVQLTVNGNSAEYFTDFVSASAGATGNLTSTEVVYVGYGIDEENYSDYSIQDIAGKVVVAKAGEPINDDGTFKVTGTKEASKWSNGRQGMRSKRNAAMEKGAKAFFMIDERMFKLYGAYYKRLADAGRSTGLSLPSNDNMYYFVVNNEMGNKLVDNFKEIDEPLIVQSKINLEYTSNEEKVDTENVIAYIKGSEHPDEYIVISAHLDHVGVDDKGEVFNGADDDGSGTVAVLEIAEAFKKAVDAGYTPKRSVVFLHVTGEERGLLGSQYYTDFDPVFPLANTVANLNIDMIGRTDPKRTEGTRNYVYLIGSDKLSTELHNISEEMNTKYANIELDYKYNDDNDPNRFYYRSDHYNFAKNNIPVIFYFNGTHEDYHKIGDTPDKIQYDLLENRAKLVFYTAWELANRDKRIVVDKAAPQP